MIATAKTKSGSSPATDLGTSQLSYAAGSTSLDPWGFRVLGNADHSRFGQLLDVFPVLNPWLSSECLIVNAYPAALGIGGFAPLVDTYLHPPTFIRSMRLAAIEDRSVVLAAQPLVGADFLLRMIAAGLEIPRRILWASGGYYFPRSLQQLITSQLAQCDCELMVLHCYGAAEVGHTCFAAIDRFASGHPRYQHVAQHVDANIAFASETLVLSTADRAIDTGDHASCKDHRWLITNAPSRLSAEVHAELESWKSGQWLRRTGYAGVPRTQNHDHSSADHGVSEKRKLAIRKSLAEESHALTSSKSNEIAAQVNTRHWQLRQSVGQSGGPQELGFFPFWEKYGGSFQSKPNWSPSSG